MLSSDFRRRVAGASKEGGASYVCGGPIQTSAQLDVIACRELDDSGALVAFACRVRKRPPRFKLIEKFPAP